jgi:hypothetical protein
MKRRGVVAAIVPVWTVLTSVLLVPILATAARAQDDRPPIRLRGLLDLAAAPNNDAVALNQLNAGGTPFDPYRARLFVEGTPSPHFDVFTQLHLSEQSGVFLYGAYATWTPWLDRDLHVQAGKIPNPIGTYPPRTYSDKNPLMGMPLIYQYHTSYRGDLPAPDVDALLSEAGRGQYGVNYVPGDGGWRGMPIVYDFCWDVGVVALGSLRPIEFALGVTNGTPSSSQPGRDNNGDKSIMGRIGVAPVPSLRLGVSVSTGAYIADELEPSLPVGTSAERYDQTLFMVDAEWAVDRLELRAEGVHNTWETPALGDLTVHGWYVEGKYAFPVGAFVAARYDQLLFDDIQGTTGPARPWDDDVRRFEGGLGYRFDRRVVAKAVYQTTTLDGRPSGTSRTSDLVGAQLSLGF